MKMEAIWFVRMAKPKAKAKPWIPPFPERRSAPSRSLLLLFFVGYLLWCVDLPAAKQRWNLCLNLSLIKMTLVFIEVGGFRRSPRAVASLRAIVQIVERLWERGGLQIFWIWSVQYGTVYTWAMGWIITLLFVNLAAVPLNPCMHGLFGLANVKPVYMYGSVYAAYKLYFRWLPSRPCLFFEHFDS
jgi:hypothetical protein